MALVSSRASKILKVASLSDGVTLADESENIG